MGLFGRKRRESGVRGTARVVSVSQPPHATHGTLTMNVVVEAPGIPAFSHEYRKFAARVDKWPEPGDVLPIEVDPTDPRDVEVLWDDLPTTRDAAKLEAERMAAMLRGQPGVQGFPGGGQGAQPVPEGMAGMVEQLQQMFPGATVDVGSGAGPEADTDTMVDQLRQMFPGAVVSASSSVVPVSPPGATPPVQVVASQAGGDPVERLAKLAQLRDAGVVDQAQFEQLKAQILAQADIDTP